MWNPLKMSSEDKKLLLGGIATGLINWGEYLAETSAPGYPAQLTQQLLPELPTNGQMLTSLGTPAVLYAVAKYGKKASLEEVAEGSIYYGVPAFITRTIVNSMQVAGGTPPAPAARLTTAAAMSKYIPTAQMPRVVPRPTGMSKYVVTS